MARKRSNITPLGRLLAASTSPIYALDDRRRIVYCNSACTQWLEVEPSKLTGLVCDYHSTPRIDRIQQIASGLCPPPDVFFDGGSMVGEVAIPDESGGRLSRHLAEFIALPKDSHVAGVVVIVGDRINGQSPPISDDTSSQLHQRLRQLQFEIGRKYRIDQIVGQSAAITRVREQVKLASDGRTRVVVSGPPGSGREYIARAIYYANYDAPIVPLACNLLDAELLETTVSSFMASCAELETEQPGTLLLLEADCLAEDAQTALAGVLSIGQVHIRTIATARRPLYQIAGDNRFRQDLALMLSTLTIEIPPLSERLEDIPILAQLFLEQNNTGDDRQLSGFSHEAIDQLTAYPWPGNVDELAVVVRQACGNAKTPRVESSDLPEVIHLAADANACQRRQEEEIILDDFLAEIEKELLQRALKKAKGNKAEAARQLGVTRQRVLRRAEFFGLDK